MVYRKMCYDVHQGNSSGYAFRGKTLSLTYSEHRKLKVVHTKNTKKKTESYNDLVLYDFWVGKNSWALVMAIMYPTI